MASQDKINWERTTEWQSRARLEEGARCILGVRQVEGRDLSPLISWKSSPRDSLLFPRRSLCLLSPHVSFKSKPGSPRLQPSQSVAGCWLSFAITILALLTACYHRRLPLCLCLNWSHCFYLLCILGLSNNRAVMDGQGIKEKITIPYC